MSCNLRCIITCLYFLNDFNDEDSPGSTGFDRLGLLPHHCLLLQRTRTGALQAAPPRNSPPPRLRTTRSRLWTGLRRHRLLHPPVRQQGYSSLHSDGQDNLEEEEDSEADEEEAEELP